MADWKNYYKKGLSQAEYRQDKARLEKFKALESDWKKLFRWVMSIARKKEFYDREREATNKLIDIWHNHVLTILIEIIQKNTEEYKDTFVRSRGTVDQKLYTKNLRGKIMDWNNRLDRFIRSQWLDDRISSHDSSMQAAQSIRRHLTDALQGKVTEKFHSGRSLNPANQPYYQMLQALRDIKRKSDQYIRMIEDSGTMDASLALLVAYIRNYCFISDKFNKSLLSLPDYYHNEILRTAERRIIQDHTYIVVTPRNEGFVLPEGTRFLAGANKSGQELHYYNEAARYLTGGRLARVCTVFLQQEEARNNRMYTQEVNFSDASDISVLFDKEMCQDVICGWMLESHMFMLEEGKRKISISFQLTDEAAYQLRNQPPVYLDLVEAFELHASYAEGWMIYAPTVSIGEKKGKTSLIFDFLITEMESSLTPCLKEMHGYTTAYPCVRIWIKNENCPYDWVKRIAFCRIGIDVEVEGIRHFNLYNELGEIDSAQSFYPFGTQAERGAWFMFCNNEITGKTVQEVSLRGIWNKLPQTPGGYGGIYKNYAQKPTLTNQSFRIKTEYKKNERWYPCPDSLFPLFQEESGILKEEAEIYFRMTEADGKPVANRYNLSNVVYGREANLFFRVTLDAPSIGFGMEAYRRLFADIMIYNSRHKEKEQKEIPVSPVIPLLSDIELSYKACWQSNDEKAIPARLSRITCFSEKEECPLDTGLSYDFVEDLKNNHNLYLKFEGMQTDRRVSIYVDLAYVKKDMFYPEDNAVNVSPYLEFDYRKDGKWLALNPENVLLEESYGLTQNGFIELALPPDLQNKPFFWLRARLQGDVGQYPAIRNIYLNCLKVVAENGDGVPLPAGTIQKMKTEDGRVGAILQPLSGFGGKAKETVTEVSIRQSARISHRNRAVAPGDYEQMVLDRFPEINKVYCLPQMCTGRQEIYIVVFSYTEGNIYPSTPAWKLSEIRNWLSGHVSPFVTLKVCNPSYRKVDIVCEAELQEDGEDVGEIRRRMTAQIQDYFALWLRTGDLPELGKKYSYKELHTRLANDPDVQKLIALTINGIQPDVQATDIDAEDQYIPDAHIPMEVVLIPHDIQIILLPFGEGLGGIEIGSNFKIE